jgi:hypothetical protein
LQKHTLCNDKIQAQEDHILRNENPLRAKRKMEMLPDQDKIRQLTHNNEMIVPMLAVSGSTYVVKIPW